MTADSAVISVAFGPSRVLERPAEPLDQESAGVLRCQVDGHHLLGVDDLLGLSGCVGDDQYPGHLALLSILSSRGLRRKLQPK
jgi:hypothetical protein